MNKMLSVPKQHFIPFSRHDVECICRDTRFVTEADFEQHRLLFSHIIDVEYHTILEQLKLAYAPFNPDLDTKPWHQSTVEPHVLPQLVEQVLTAANYQSLSEQDLASAMTDQSLCDIKLDVDFSEFSQLLVFSRGEHVAKRTVKRFGPFGRKDVEFVNYERVFIFLRYQEQQWFDDNKRKVPTQVKPGGVMLKLFKDVPKADLEMLFPNGKIKMRNRDKLLIGLPALASGGIILATKLGATMVLLAALLSFYLGWSDKEVILDQKNILILAAGLATLGGYFWKQFSVFNHKKIKFMQSLSESLYYKALDNNMGVFHYLIDNAKESEGKELILAWTFMQKLGCATAAELDSTIESYFEKTLQTELDFDVEDALAKLVRLALVEKSGNGYQAIEPHQSLSNLQAQWQAKIALPS